MATTGIPVDYESLWSSTTEKILIDILVDEVNKGNMKDGQFSKKTWSKILEELKTKSRWNFSMAQVKQKFNRLRARYRDFNELLKQAGFRWDAERNIVHATKETWQNYLLAHSRASSFRKKGCAHYKLLGLIFNQSALTGALHLASTQNPHYIDNEMELENDFLHSSTHVDLDANSASYDDPLHDPNRSISHTGKRAATTRAEGGIRKENITQQMGDALQEWAKAKKAKIEVSLPKAERYKTVKSVEDNSSSIVVDFSLTRCVHLLEEIDRIDDDTYLKAIERFRDQDWREIFVSMSMDRKKAWLARLK